MKIIYKITFIASLLISCTVASAQSKSKVKSDTPKGFTITPNKLVYKLLRTNKNARTSKISDVLSFRAQYFIKKNNHLHLWSSRAQTGQFPYGFH